MRTRTLVGIVTATLLGGALALASPALAGNSEVTQDNVKQTIEQALSQMPLPEEGYENISLRPPYIPKEEVRIVDIITPDCGIPTTPGIPFVYLEHLFRTDSFNVILYPPAKPGMQK